MDKEKATVYVSGKKLIVIRLIIILISIPFLMDAYSSWVDGVAVRKNRVYEVETSPLGFWSLIVRDLAFGLIPAIYSFIFVRNESSKNVDQADSH